MKFFCLLKFGFLFLCLAFAAVQAQQSVGVEQQQAKRVFTKEDYDRAARFLNFNVAPLVDGAIRVRWIGEDRAVYRKTSAGNSEFILIDAKRGTKKIAFDHAKIAAALSAAVNLKVDAKRLPFVDFQYSADEQSIVFNAFAKRWTCDLSGAKCVGEANQFAARGFNPNEVLSPDGKRAAFIRDWNLWMRDVASGRETQLTADGVKDYGYATDNAGWRQSDRPVVAWSPDSKRIATFQQDQRKTGEMYLIETRVGHPKLKAWKYPLPGDENVTMIERVVIDTENPRVVRFKMPPDQHRTTLCDDISCNEDFTDVEWSADSSSIAFVSSSRDHKIVNLRVANPNTGDIREVYTETSPTQFESGTRTVNWRYLPKTNEFIWFTERDGWGHLYLYDLATGRLKNQITKGNWAVWQILRVDEANRVIYFTAGGRETGRDPYFAHFYRVNFDGGNLQLLTPEDGNHEIALSPGGNYFVDAFSKPDTPPTFVLRDLDGKQTVQLEKVDISRLAAVAGWKPPQPITVKSRDGRWDLYGLMFTPTNLDPNKKYPVVNYIYPGPQGGGVGTRSFVAARGDHQALAELGFVVVVIDGTCNPLRSKAFHDSCYGNMADNTLPDQIAGIRELAAKYKFLDLERVGIWGHSGGGFATAAAMFRYPDFYKVGISESGNHDNRNYEDDWGERYIGLLVKDKNGKSNYEDQANQNFAKNLKGHLLLAHGTMDDNVPPDNTLLVVDALIKANKDFDLLLLPNRPHGYQDYSFYMMRRRWDYFVRHLMHAQPPIEYEIKLPAPPR
jgi:dipeptidyl-peptidase-4